MADEIIKIDGDLFGDIQPNAAPKSNPSNDPMGLNIMSGDEKGISINLDENLGNTGGSSQPPNTSGNVTQSSGGSGPV
jgi:hypothetical protein